MHLCPGSGCAFVAGHESSVSSRAENSCTFSWERQIDWGQFKERELSRWLARLHSALGKSRFSEQHRCLRATSTESTAVPREGSGGRRGKALQSGAERMSLFSGSSRCTGSWTENCLRRRAEPLGCQAGTRGRCPRGYVCRRAVRGMGVRLPAPLRRGTQRSPRLPRAQRSSPTSRNR